MSLEIEEQNLKNVHIVGDRILIKPKTQTDKTKSGLYLPPTVKEKEKALLGYVVKTGPGYPIPAIQDENEPWKENKEEVKYIPLQAKEGDLAVFLNNSGYEVSMNNEKYIIIPQSAVLMLVRDDGLFS